MPYPHLTGVDLTATLLRRCIRGGDAEAVDGSVVVLFDGRCVVIDLFP